ncbi:asparagine synthetase B family protein [Vibrio harveyi]|uniref:asparagine synthetase B family protein n=1 Tax=Vibrio harveyi TaxID=669 RepID=UPI003CFA2CF4
MEQYLGSSRDGGIIEDDGISVQPNLPQFEVRHNMCGIFISNEPQVTQEHSKIIEDCLRFRGPDCSSGLVEHSGWKAYHSRLSIIELGSGSNQPVIDGKGGMLVFNGEILNYKELGFKYFEREYTSDTTLLSDLIVSGKLLENELDGFFAFVYVNPEGTLQHACRDKFGVKPLFYFESDDGISFSSEPNVLKELFDLPVNPQVIEEYHAARAPIFSGSYFDGVSVVEPGSCFVNGCYFESLDYFQKYTEVSQDELERHVKDGINSRLVADAKVGLLMSRGIDSNLIHQLSDIEKLYTIGFKGDEDITFLKSQNIPNLTIYECDPAEYKQCFDELIALRGEPMSVPNEVLLYRISKVAASDGVKVLLSGEGADEFFGGYDRVFNWAATCDSFDLDTFLNFYCYKVPDKGTKTYKHFSMLFDELEHLSPFEKVRYFFIKYHMPVLFRRLDFALMAAGVEGRDPIANHHVFEAAIKFSASQLMNGSLGKLPLRGLIAPLKGDEFAYEKKVGFPVDLTKVFDNPRSLSSYELWFEENLKVLLK